jgi:hypothetical protein
MSNAPVCPLARWPANQHTGLDICEIMTCVGMYLELRLAILGFAALPDIVDQAAGQQHLQLSCTEVVSQWIYLIPGFVLYPFQYCSSSFLASEMIL